LPSDEVGRDDFRQAVEELSDVRAQVGPRLRHTPGRGYNRLGCGPSASSAMVPVIHYDVSEPTVLSSAMSALTAAATTNAARGWFRAAGQLITDRVPRVWSGRPWIRFQPALHLGAELAGIESLPVLTVHTAFWPGRFMTEHTGRGPASGPCRSDRLVLLAASPRGPA